MKIKVFTINHATSVKQKLIITKGFDNKDISWIDVVKNKNGH